MRLFTQLLAQSVVKLIELESCVSLSLKILECRDEKICPKEAVNSWDLLRERERKKKKNSLVIGKGIYCLFSLET